MIPVQVADRIADTGAVVAIATPTAFAIGISIQEVNLWLQALAFMVAIVSGLCAARYYWRKGSER